MHAYMTRHLVALAPLTYCGQHLEAGEEFIATPDDERYLVKHQRACAVPLASPPAQAKPAAPVQAAAPRNAAEPSVEPAAADPVAEPVPADEAKPEPAAVQPVGMTTTTRRPYVRRNQAGNAS